MGDLFFWKSWQKHNRILVTAFFIFFCITAAYLVYGYFYGLSNIIDWNSKQQLVPVVNSRISFDNGPLKIWLPVQQYLVFQYFDGSILKINPVFWTFYLILLVISINLVLAVVSSISKFWFYGAMGAFIGFIILFQPDHILLFSSSNKSASILIFSVFLSISYIFREFKNHLSLSRRFLVFVAATTVTGLIIYFYSGVEHPFSYLVSYGIAGPLVVSMIFILTVSHEIIYAFLRMSSGSARSGSSRGLVHFTVLSVIYLFYTFITYLHNAKRLDWNLVYLNPIVLLLIISYGGFWWLRDREELYEEILPFRPNAALLFLAFGSITLATYGFILSVGNDPVAETFEDTIIFGQIGFGIFFFIYLVANFGQMMSKGYNVVPVAYKSRTIPFFVFRLGGLLAAGFMLYQAGFLPFFQAKAGYYNLLGDLFWLNKEQSLAKVYYQKASGYEYQNHRSNYALASIARLEKNKAEEIFYLEKANLKQPSPYSFVNVSNRLLENDQYFEGLFKLNEGLTLFPGSPEINNNIGYFYSKTDIYDSAYYFFNQARLLNPHSGVIRANSYALITKASVKINLDSVVSDIGPPESEAGFANMTALANDNLIPVDTRKYGVLPDSIDSPVQFAMLYNRGLNRLNSGDTVFYNKIKKIANSVHNPLYDEGLTFIYGLGLYKCHQIGNAINTLGQLANDTYPDTRYRNYLATLFLISGDSYNALDSYGDYNSLNSWINRFYYGVALMNTGKSDSASMVFRDVQNCPDPDIRNIAGQYQSLLNVKSLSDSLSDNLIYNLFYYRPESVSQITVQEFIQKVKNPEIRDLIRLEESLHQLHSGNIADAEDYLKSLENTGVDMPKLKVLKEKAMLLLMALKIRDSGKPDSTGYVDRPLNDPNYLYYVFRNAMVATVTKDSAAAEKYNEMLTWNPFFETGILAAADYYNDRRHDPFKAYRTLFNALTINKHSIILNKRFILQAIDMNTPDYAADNISLLKNLLDEEEFHVFELEMKTEANKVLQNTNEWGN